MSYVAGSILFRGFRSIVQGDPFQSYTEASQQRVKDAAEFISQPLKMIFNTSLKFGIFPDIRKLANFSPMFNTGARNNKNHYRPISVLSIFSKLIEKIVHDQLLNFMQLNKILIPNQFAFKKLHSTITSLINVSDYWYENINEKKVNIALFLDLKKGFDTVDHEILISKLDSYGVQGDAKEWFVSYLNNRYQYCSLDGYRSTAKMITCGIPQGSCLGPLLFIIYLNDFTSCLQFSKVNLYADDTETTISSSDIGDLTRSFQTELDNISDWMRVNKLGVNPDKTEFMIIGNPRRTNKFADLPPFFLGKK